MTGKISLTASMRSNLLSLQNISRQVCSTQNKLATGNKVNSAIDNPSSYYTARSLTNRANDLDALLDSMGQAVSTIKTATTALETGATFLEQASAIATQALENPAGSVPNVNLVTKDLAEYIADGYTAITADMTADDISALLVDGAKLVLADDIVLDGCLDIGKDNITINGNGHKITYDDSDIQDEYALYVDSQGVKLSNIEIDYTGPYEGSSAIYVDGGNCSLDISSIKITVHGDWAVGVDVRGGAKVTLDTTDGIQIHGIGAQKVTGNDNSGFYDGKGNTQKIVAQLGDKALAAWASTQFYVGDKNGAFGQGQWYLPAIGELINFYGTDTNQIPEGEFWGNAGAIGDNKAKINAALTTLEGKGAEAEAMSFFLWSSSEGSNNLSWLLDLSRGYCTSSSKGDLYRVRPCQLLENCFDPTSGSTPKIGDVMYVDRTWGSANDYDGSKQAVGIVSAVGNDGSVKIISLKNLTFSSQNFDPDNPYGGTGKRTRWATDDEANTNIIDLPNFTAGKLTILDNGGGAQTGAGDSAQERFNNVLNQYDMLIKDASYKGINLLRSQNLNVRFNESGSSDLNVIGKDASVAGLGLNKAEWKSLDDVAASIKELATAMNKIRNITSELGNNYSIVSSRQEFTENLINILTEGADKLTLADMNEESANMLALQTRQQLAINSLSLASQAAQAVMKLF